MLRFFFLLCLLTFFMCSNGFSQVHKRYLQEANGVEYFVSGAGISSTGRVLHESVFRGHTTNVIKKVNGKTIYDVNYTLSKNGFRQSDSSNKLQKKKHFFLIGGSIAFGEGLKDDETITHWLNLRSSKVESYPIGFLGHGPQHTWYKFNKKYLARVVPQKKGSAVIIAHEDESGKLLGTIAHLFYAARFPVLKKKNNNEFYLDGTFKTDGSIVQKYLIEYCLPFLVCKRMLSFFHQPPSEKDLKKLIDVFTSIENMYRQQFQVENVYLLWVGEEKWINFIKKNSQLKILTLKFEKFDISHPNSKGAKQIADYLLSHKELFF